MPRDRREGRIDVDDGPVGIRNHDALGRGLEDRRRSAHGLFGLVALGHVAHGPVDATRFSFKIEVDIPTHAVVLDAAVAHDEAGFGALRARILFDQRAKFALDSLPIVGMNALANLFEGRRALANVYPVNAIQFVGPPPRAGRQV